MAASYERIHYGLRPAKNVQRKMLAEAFRRLSEFGSLESYRYVGLGSPYFNDFILFHKSLGIRQMISIERDVGNRRRFEFNRPFNCVQMNFGESTEVLPRLSWLTKTILWLDYDGTLEPSVFADVKLFCASAVSGSVLIVTVNAEPVQLDPDVPRVLELQNRLGRERVPPELTEEDLTQWGTARVYRRILTSHILETLAERNGGLSRENKFEFMQLFYFCYKDGSDRMLTVGGLVYEKGQSTNVAKCGFDLLSFVRDGHRRKTPCLIDVPKLTYKEMRYLDRQLPRNKKGRLAVPKVPAADVKTYERIYRYFPTFAEAEL